MSRWAFAGILVSLGWMALGIEARGAGDGRVASGVWHVGSGCERPGCETTRLLIEVSRGRDIGDELSVVTRDAQGRPRQVFRRAEGDRFLGMYPTRDVGGHLVTVWIGGSAYKLAVLREKDGHVTQVLATGSESMPEVVYCASGEAMFLITHWTWTGSGDGRQKTPSETAILKWHGDAYAQVETSAWPERGARAMARCSLLK